MDEPTELELRSDPAEAALLGIAAFHGHEITGILEQLPGEDFWNPHRGNVWNAIRKLAADGEPLDPVTVSRRLVTDGTWSQATQQVIATDLLAAEPVTFAHRHADTVADLARRRELMRSLARARRLVATHPGDASEILAAVAAEFSAPVKAETARHKGALSWPQLVAEFREHHRPDEPTSYIATPWDEFNERLGGLAGGRVYVFGGRPGAGKSMAAINIAAEAAIHGGHKVLVVSKEMPTVDVTGRILARGAEVNLKEISSRALTRTSRDKIESYIASVGNPELTVDARPRRLSGVLALARTQAARRGLDLLVVDYLQLVKTDTPARTREQEVAAVSIEMKALALELGCVVVLPAQLNRGSTQRIDPRPTMSDLRDSGQIEQDADVVTLLHRERNEKGEPTGKITFIVDKNRHGPTGDITLDWHGGYGAIT